MTSEKEHSGIRRGMGLKVGRKCRHLSITDAVTASINSIGSDCERIGWRGKAGQEYR